MGISRERLYFFFQFAFCEAKVNKDWLAGHIVRGIKESLTTM